MSEETDQRVIPRKCGNCDHEWLESPNAGPREIARCPRCNPVGVQA